MVEMARCLMLDPKLMLLDEPSLGLDPRSLAAVADLIHELHQGGMTVLLVEQNVRLGLGLATHGVVMEGGKVRLTGPATEVRNHPEIAALYLGGAGPCPRRPEPSGLEGPVVCSGSRSPNLSRLRLSQRPSARSHHPRRVQSQVDQDGTSRVAARTAGHRPAGVSSWRRSGRGRRSTNGESASPG